MPTTTAAADAAQSVHVTLASVFASRKSERSAGAVVVPSTFQVSAKIDEELRKEGRLELSFSLALSDPKNMVSFELRGSCTVTGDASAFDQLMDAPSRAGAGTGSRLPPILDIIYRQVYPSVFMLAGMTSSTYPQSTALAPEHIVDQIRSSNNDDDVKSPSSEKGGEKGKGAPAAAKDAEAQ